MDHGYGKWPVLVVAGDDVTPEQAAEIIVATTIWDLTLTFQGADLEWSAKTAAAMGVFREDLESSFVDRDSIDRFFERIGFEQVEYAHNDRILPPQGEASNGWLSLDGRVGTCGTYFASKWPRPEDVDAEWRRIAARFPYLNLRAQLLEIDFVPEPYEFRRVLKGWRVKDGEMSFLESDRLVQWAMLPTTEEQMARIRAAALFKGTDPELVRAAVSRLEESA